jgi:hypothetical protein
MQKYQIYQPHHRRNSAPMAKGGEKTLLGWMRTIAGMDGKSGRYSRGPPIVQKTLVGFNLQLNQTNQ